MDDSANVDELRALVRRTLLDMLQPGSYSRSIGDQSEEERPRIPPIEVRDQELQVMLRGSQRAIGLLEQALSSGGGDTTVEISIESTWGPRARVRLERA